MRKRPLELTPETDIQFLKGVGPVRARLLAKLSLCVVGDLLEHYPHDYLERGRLVPLGQVREGMRVITRGAVLHVEKRRTRRRQHMITVLLGAGSARLRLVWFNASYLADRFRLREQLVVSGEVVSYGTWLQIVNPEFEAEGEAGELVEGRPQPRYPLTAGLKQGAVRRMMDAALNALLDGVRDPLPAALRQRLGLVGRAEALRRVHRPSSLEEVEEGRRRVAFDEAFSLQLAVQQRHGRRLRRRAAIQLGEFGELSTRLVESLPFELTGAQRRVLAAIARDLRAPSAMHRLLQGDVGSGKTLVALIAMLWMVESKAQATFMAPTEVLALQQGRKAAPLLSALGVDSAVLTSSTPTAERREILNRLAGGDLPIVFGTHALIQDDVEFARLGLAVVDEQHRFGVVQRAQLAGRDAHLLVMTATPIPRSLALTVLGDLDLSVIDELPPGRKPVETVLAREGDLPDCYRRVHAAAARGERSYLVFPLVDESEKLDVASATEAYERLRETDLKGLRIELLHGRLSSRDKQAISERFESGELDVVVATTVIEVGMDVPEATLMIVHSAERFGLAQLHQLRGRVGRGGAQATCVLVQGPGVGQLGRDRLRLMTSTNDGFALAEEDLRARGMGELYGTRQHGDLPFKLLHPLQDEAILRAARETAREILANDPELSDPSHRSLRSWLDSLGARSPFWSAAG